MRNTRKWLLLAIVISLIVCLGIVFFLKSLPVHVTYNKWDLSENPSWYVQQFEPTCEVEEPDQFCEKVTTVADHQGIEIISWNDWGYGGANPDYPVFLGRLVNAIADVFGDPPPGPVIQR